VGQVEQVSAVLNADELGHESVLFVVYIYTLPTPYRIVNTFR
jgi:hypothetical protein